MKGERKPGLKLVPPVGPSGGGGDEPPFTEDELREAVATREAVERGDEPVSSSLRAAWRPAPLDDEAHAALVERAFKEVEARREEGGEALAEPDEAELAAAERLRAALDELGPGTRPAVADAEDGSPTHQPLDVLLLDFEEVFIRLAFLHLDREAELGCFLLVPFRQDRGLEESGQGVGPGTR